MNKLTGLLLACSVFVMSCGKLTEPEFRRLEKFGVKKIGFQDVTVGFVATYFNPNNFGVTVKDADFDVFVDSAYLGKFTQPAATDVNSNSEFSIPLEGTIAFNQAMKLDLQNLVGKKVLVKANGNVKIGKGGVFMTKPISYQGMQTIDAGLLK
jgi:LEA14-like dessication related protein